MNEIRRTRAATKFRWTRDTPLFSFKLIYVVYGLPSRAIRRVAINLL